MSAEHHGPEAALDRRSALPSIPGIPWWGAIVLAVTATAIGFAYDAGTGDKELSAFFTFCYVAGCVLAVLGVRRSGIFTAVIQPPLILFVAVPGAYFMFHSDKIAGIKDLLINCGYPLIERFPTMFFTAATVLILGLIRWFVLPQFLTYEEDDADEVVAEPKPRRSRRQADDEDVAPAGLAATLSAKLTKLTTGQTPRSSRTRATPSRRSAAESPRRGAADPQRAPRPSRARAQAGDTELIEPVPGQMRRPRPARPRPAATDSYAVPDEPRRRPRPAGEPRRAAQERYDYREPRERDRYERPAQRPSASEPRRRRYADDPYEPGDRYQSPARPSRSAPPSGAHHPVSRVRYRGADDDVAPEPRERRPRQPHNWD
ncbi:MAG: hypothetical protein EKK51_14805 [Mycolicibacterium sp.]|uniref:DUF6542 domain-containing protein n=1 Tax=Mycolicibacterium sp. TaxID=2320850 RepID=UPI000FC0D6F5|nr:DUF6542 domain-containing protein [Mycolicibacterium sp.]RUP31262.1 MAG: hypothetical protein EKK51_14805 [Mycolicibacterium sp.]